MDFQKFTRVLQTRMQLFAGSDCEITLQEVTKNNGLKKTGLMAKKEGISTYPTVYVDDYYDPEMKELEIEYLAMKLSQMLLKHIPKEDIDVGDFLDFEIAQERIVYKLVNAELNKKELLDIPHRRFHNLAVVYYYLMDSETSLNNVNVGNATIMIKSSHLKLWNKTEEDIFKVAKENTPRLLPPLVESLSNMILEMTDIEVDYENTIFVATNDRKSFGAGTILYDGVLKELADRIGKNIYILPSSVHETILLKEDDEHMPSDVKELLSMVSTVNKNEVDPMEVLADSIYYYDRELDEIVWVC